MFVNIIKKYNLPYEVQSTKIISKSTGATIAFIGLSDITADNIKSYEDFKVVWLEEAQKIKAEQDAKWEPGFMWDTKLTTTKQKETNYYD